MHLGPGLWALTVQAIAETQPPHWVYPLPPQFVYFQSNNQPEIREQNFAVLMADAQVIGAVELPDGSTPPFTVTVSLHTDEGIGLRTAIDPADGSFDLSLPSGGYKVFVHPQDEAFVGPLIEPVVVPPNGMYDLGTLTLLPRDA
jgi:hypothetical protein